jgi:putative transposase
MKLPQRRRLYHAAPSWVASDEVFFVTINCAQRRTNQLCQSASANALLEAARHYHQQNRWFIYLFLLMPDHLHTLFSLPPDENLKAVVRGWKRYTAKAARIVWQDGFFDHRLRREIESREAKASYILQNPVRAGLTAQPDDWPYVLYGSDVWGKADSEEV